MIARILALGLAVAALVWFLASFSGGPARARAPFAPERRLANLRQLTFGGQNAEAYWNQSGTRIVFQTTRPPYAADQIFTMAPDGGELVRVSNGEGRTTCAFFLPGDERILFASTHHAEKQPATPPPFDPKVGYTWSVWSSYEIYTAKADGTDFKRLTDSPGYDAEAVVSPKGDRIVFTSVRDGDLDLYTMALDGSDVKRVTTTPGYDGGAFFSPDGKRLCFRSSYRADLDVKAEHDLLSRQLVRPSALEICICDVDGSNRGQLTSNGAANFGPYWHPDGKRIIFSSNMHAPKRGNFELYLIDVATRAVERVTYFERTRPGARRPDDFDGFPMFSPDGKRLLFCSNRFNDQPNETNVFLAEWVD